MYKCNPMDQALAPRDRVWRKKVKDFHLGVPQKGSACGTGGNYVHFLVNIIYGKGVIAMETYSKMCGEYSADFLRRTFDTLIGKSGKGT